LIPATLESSSQSRSLRSLPFGVLQYSLHFVADQPHCRNRQDASHHTSDSSAAHQCCQRCRANCRTRWLDYYNHDSYHDLNNDIDKHNLRQKRHHHHRLFDLSFFDHRSENSSHHNTAYTGQRLHQPGWRAYQYSGYFQRCCLESGSRHGRYSRTHRCGIGGDAMIWMSSLSFLARAGGWVALYS